MRRTSGWAAIALVIAAVGALGAGQKVAAPVAESPAAPAAGGKADPEVTRLIADLGAADYRTREKAGAALTALGEKALPEMHAALLATDSPEVQRRLAVLVRKMDVERLTAPKRVTLSVKDKPAKEVFDGIAKQTNYKIEYGGGDGLKHSFEFDNTPFWVAIDKVAEAAGCSVVPDYDDESIRVYNQDSVNPYVAYAGPFRFLATNINSSKNIQLSGISRRGGGVYRNEYMNLNFQVQSEPKNPMLGVTQPEVISAADENGSSLVPPKERGNRSYYENRGNRGHNMYSSLNLNRTGGGSGTTIKSLKAKIGIIMMTGTAPEIVVADPLKVKTKSFVGRTVEMDFGSFAEDPGNKGQYTLDVTLKQVGNTDPNRIDYNWSNNIWSKIEVFDAAGNKYQNYGPNNINHNGTSIQITVPYGSNDRRTGKELKLGPPAKVVVNEWLSVTHEVTFEFQGIPLP